jgi:hypothetical protein
MVDLWCVHIIGPDDVIAYSDRAAAESSAAEINDALAVEEERHKGDPNWPACRAEALLWPYGAEAHAVNLARKVR